MAAIDITRSSREMIIYALGSTLCFILAYTSGIYALALIPFIYPAVILVAAYPALIFAGLFIAIPFSRHTYVGMGVSTELFSEQFMWILCIVAVLYFFLRGSQWDYKYLVHPITLLLLFHLAWTTYTGLFSVNQLISAKFLLSKTWFTIALFCGGLYFFRDRSMWRTFFWCTYISILIIVAIIMFRHQQVGFSFEEIEEVISPLFANHVYYAAVLTLFFPFLFVALNWYKRFSPLWWLVFIGVGILPLAIALTYTRAAIIVTVAYIFIYFIFKWKLVKWAILASIIGASVLVGYLLKDNKYLDYAPQYTQTISFDEFGNLVSGTFEGRDISTMERVYRWVAAYQMIQEKPWKGFGPGTFPTTYKNYTVNMFSTYVSANKQGSGIHSYFLMVLVEQGFPGLIIFVLLLSIVLIRGEKVYHRIKKKEDKDILLALLVIFVGVIMFNLINDMIEVDKVACYFFWTMAMIIILDFKSHPEQNQALGDGR